MSVDRPIAAVIPEIGETFLLPAAITPALRSSQACMRS